MNILNVQITPHPDGTPIATTHDVKRFGWRSRWPRWTPYAAVLWSFGIAGLALVWVLSGSGYPPGGQRFRRRGLRLRPDPG